MNRLANKMLPIKLHRFNWFILVVTVAKIIVMGLFTSDYTECLFKPFIMNFLNHIQTGSDPYAFIIVPGKSVFPYFPLMLLIESVGGILMKLFSFLPMGFENILFKLPSLLFDYVGMFYLVRLYPNKRKYIGVLYFASPIIFYATYMHGQLDIIPTAFLLGALYYLTTKQKRSDLLFVLFLAAAICTKSHILAVVPLAFIYLYKKYNISRAVRLTGAVFLAAMIFTAPFLTKSFIQNVIFNPEQNALMEVYFSFDGLKMFIPILALLLIYLSAVTVDNINKDLLVSFCGLLFAVFLALVPPMPGWYVWIVPFITVVFINATENKALYKAICLLLNGLYLLYFVFAHRTEYVDLYFQGINLSFLKINNITLKNLLFTVLTGALLYTIYLLYSIGVSSNSYYKRRGLPFIIGISGDSGTGKSKLLQSLDMLFGENNILNLEGDGDHKWERSNIMWKQLTHLDPHANYLYRQAKDLAMLRKGNYIMRVDYDHDAGCFTVPHRVDPKKFIVLCGLHALYLPQTRMQIDLKIYMDTDETLRRFWKIRRDTTTRGYSGPEILQQINARMPDAVHYIYPQKRYADLLIRYFDDTLRDCMNLEHEVSLDVKCRLSASIDLDMLLSELAERGINYTHDYDQDLTHQTLIIPGNPLKDCSIPLNQLAHDMIPQLDEIIPHTIDWKPGIDGLVQLLILITASNKMRGSQV